MNQPRTQRSPVAQRRHFALHPLSLALMLGFSGSALALPNAGTVVSGQVTIQNPSANLQVVTQGSQRGIIDWKSFSIGSGQTVRFNQPSSSAVLLNRVTGYDPSEILGQMQANGRIFLLNPNGVVFGSSARVDVGGMVASTLSLSNADFNAGRYQLGAGAGGAHGAVRNDGVITSDGGTIALVAPRVTNTGTIEANGGRVGLAAADAVLVDVEGDGLIFFNASATGMRNRLEHLGRIRADGGTVEMRAAARASMADTVLNMDGIVQARSLGVHNGQVVIDGGTRGITAVSGSVDVSGRDAGETGGTAKVLGRLVGLFGDASLDASGDAGGGTVLVGGNYQGKGPEHNAFRTFASPDARIDVSATGDGDGGRAIVWANDVTRFHGSVSARGGAAGGDGGFVEVSGKATLVFRGKADLTAPAGKGGTLLLDPENIILENGTGKTNLIGTTGSDGLVATYAFGEDAGDTVTLDATALNGIAGGEIVLQANNDVTFNTNLTFATAAKALRIEANNDIQLNGNTIQTNGGNITLTANFDNAGGGSILGNGILIASAAAGSGAKGGDITLSAAGTGQIAVASITSTGGSGASAATGVTGGAGGAVQITAGSGGIAIGAGGITTTGGNGGNSTTDGNNGGTGGAGGAVTLNTTGGVSFAASGRIAAIGGVGGIGAGGNGDDGGTGGAGGNVSITAGAGGVSFDTQGIAATGGVGGDAGNTGDNGGVGGLGGTVTIVSAGNVSFTNGATVNARGGTGGDGDGGAGDVGGTGGLGNTISIRSSAGAVQLGVVEANGGDGGRADKNDAGSTAAASGAGNDITLRAGTDLTLSGAVTSTDTAGVLIDLRFGEGGANSVLTLPAFALTGQTVTAAGGAGTGDRIVLTANSAAITLTATELNNGGGGVVIGLTNVEDAVITGGAAAQNINVSAWGGTSRVVLSGGADNINGNDSSTTLAAATGGGAQTFTVDAGNGGSVGATDFTNVGRLLGADGNDTFSFGASGTLTGGVDGGTGTNVLDVSARAAVTWNLATGAITGAVPAIANVQSVVGNGANSTIVGTGGTDTFTVNNTNAGSVGGVGFSGFAHLDGAGGDDVFNLTTVAANSGSLASITGGTGSNTLSYAGYTAGPVTFNVNSGAATGVTAAPTGIAVLVGNGTNTTLASNATGGATFTLTAQNTGNVTGPTTLAFSAVNSLSGGTGADTIVGSGGRLTGTITDAGGTTNLQGTIDTDGAQSYTGAVQLGAATTLVSGVTGANAAVTFGSTVNGGFALEVQTAGITSFGGDVGTTVALASVTTDAGGTTVLPGTVRTTSHQRFNDAASGTTVSLNITGAGDVTLGAGSDVDTLNVTVGGATTLLVNDADDLRLGTVTLGGGTARFVVADSIVRSTPLTLGGATLTLNVGGGVDVTTSVTNVFGSALAAYTEVEVSRGASAAADNVRIDGTGALDPLVVTGNLAVTATGSITQGGPLSVAGSSSFTAIGQGVALTDPANDFVGPVAVNVGAASAGNVDVRDANALVLGNMTLGTGALTLVANAGDLTQAVGTSIVQAPGAASATLIAFGGAVAVTNTTNDFTGSVLLVGNGSSVGVADATDLTVDLSLFPNGGNTGVTAIAGGALTLLGAPVSFSTGTGEINLQSLGGPLTLAVGTTLQTTTGDITLASAGGLTVQGVSTVSGNLSFTATGGNVTLAQPITTGGNLNIVTSGDIAPLGGVTLDIGGSFSGSAGGQINVNGNFGGLGPLTAAGNISVVDNDAGAFPATGLTLGGNITSSGGGIGIQTGGTLALGNRTLNAANSVILFASNGVTSTGGSIDGGAGQVFINGFGGAVTLGSRTLAGESVAVGGAGGVTGSGSIDAGAGTVLVSGIDTGAIALSGPITTTNTSTTAVRLIEATSLTIGAITTGAGGTVVLGEAGGNEVGGITQTGAINAGTLTGVSTGNVTLGGANQLQQLGPFSAAGSLTVNDLGGLGIAGPVSAGSGALSITSTGALAIGGSNLSGTGVTLQANGITSTGGAVSGGTGPISIDGQAGAISLAGLVQTSSNAANALVIRDATSVTLGGGVSTGATGTLTLGVAGDITGNVSLGGTALLSTGTLTASTGGSLNLGSTNAANNVATVGAVTTNGAFTLRDAVGDLAITGPVGAGTGAVDIQTAGALTTSGTVTGVGVTLAGASVALGATVAGGAGPVQLTATGGNISQATGTVTTAGALGLSATGSANLANPVTIGSLGASTVGGALTLTHTGALVVSGIVNAGSLDLTGSSIALNAAVTSGGTTTLDATTTTITQSAALNTVGLVATAAGNVTLTNAANRIGTVQGSSTGGSFQVVDSDLGMSLSGAVSGQSVSLQTVGALALGTNTVSSTGGNVTLNGGGVSGTGAVTAGGAGDLNVDGGGGPISLTGGLTAAGNSVVLLDGGATTIGNVTAATLELGRTGVGNTLGSVTQQAATAVNATLLSGAVTGTAALGNANTVTNLGPFTAGSLVLADAGGLGLVGNVVTTSAVGTLQITTTGALQLGGSTVQSAGTLALAGTSLAQTAGGDVIAAGAATLDGGAGGIDLTEATNSFGGDVTLRRTGGAVDLQAGGSLNVVSLDAVADQPVTLVAANNLTLQTGGLLDIGTADLTLEATTGNLTISGDISANVLDLTAGGTISLAGVITTTGAQTYSGAVTLLGNTTMNAGASQIALQGGATSAVGANLVLTSSNAAADAISTGGAISGIGALTVNGNITLGGNVSGSGAQTYNDAVVLGAPVITLNAGAGNVTFDSTVDGTAPGAQSLVVTSSGVTRFNGTVGTGVALDDLTTNGGGSTVLAGAGSSGTPFVTTQGDQLYDEPTAIASDTLLRANRVTFGSSFDAGTFEIAFQVAQDLVFNGPILGSGRIVLSAQGINDSIGLAGAAGDLQISQATLNQLSGFATIVIGAVDFAGDVQSNAVTLPTNLQVRTLAGTVDFNGTILSSGGSARDLTIDAGGLTSFLGTLGDTGTGVLGAINVSGDLAIGAAAVRSTGAQTYGGNVTVQTPALLSGSAIDIAGTLSAGANNVTLLADAIAVNAVGPITGTVRLGGSADSTAIGIATADIAGRLDLSQTLLDTFGSAANLVIGRADGTGGITANAFTLSTDTRIESASGNVALTGTINSATGTNHALEIGTAGLTTFGGAVGATQALGSLEVEGASRLNGGSLRTTGAQTYTGAVQLGAATTLTGDTVAFGSTVDGAFGLAVNATTTTFGAAVGAGTALASLSTNAAGTTTLGGNVSTTGTQTYGDAVVLGANATLAASRATFAGTINGARALQIDAAGGVTLGGSVGNTAALTQLEINGPTTIAGAEVSTTGTQRYAGAVTLSGAATTLVGSGLAFTSTVNGANDLVLQSSGTTSFGGNVGTTTALRSIDSQGTGDVVLLGNTIRTSGAQSYAGALRLNGNTTLQGGALLFASGVSGADALTLRTDALSAQAAITGSGVLTIAPLSQGTTIGIAGGAGDLQITQAILTGADDFSRLVIGRADGTGAINAGNLRLFDDTRILSRTGDIRLNGRVDGAVNLQLDTGGTTRIAGPVGSDTALLSLTTDNNPDVADWNGTTGERTLFDAGGGRAVVTTEGAQTYNDPVVTTVPVTFSASNLVAAQTGNSFGAAVNLNAQTVTLRSGQTIELGDVTITNGGSVETGGVLRLSGALRLEGGTLVLSSLATPTALDDFTDPELAGREFSVGLVPVREASATIEQTGTGTIATAANTLLVLRSSGGGSMNLLGDNAVLGAVSAVSGRLGESDSTRFNGPGAVTIGFVRLNSTEINVAGAPPANGDQTLQRAGIEADAVWLRADKLSTGPEGQIRGRIPFNNFQGSDTSVPGITLVMSETALSEGGGFGGASPDTWIQVSVGDERGGFLTVRPKGENGPNAFILLGGDVDARPFYDGAGKITEIRVFYNGETPRTAQEQGALSAVQALAEDARQSRFEEAVRTENVRQRLRSGVIAEVGAGRPATVGRESIKLPDNCEPAGKSLSCQ